MYDGGFDTESEDAGAEVVVVGRVGGGGRESERPVFEWPYRFLGSDTRTSGARINGFLVNCFKKSSPRRRNPNHAF